MLKILTVKHDVVYDRTTSPCSTALFPSRWSEQMEEALRCVPREHSWLTRWRSNSTDVLRDSLQALAEHLRSEAEWIQSTPNCSFKRRHQQRALMTKQRQPTTRRAAESQSSRTATSQSYRLVTWRWRRQLTHSPLNSRPGAFYTMKNICGIGFM